MTKIASMKVQVSAETSRFDAAMGRIRQQMKGVQQSASITGGAGLGPLGGRLGAMAGMMSMSGPMLAVAAATAGLATALEATQRDQARGTSNLNEIMASRLSVVDAARFQRVSQMAMGEGGTAGDAAGALRAFRDPDFATKSKLFGAGVTPGELAAISGASDAEALRLMLELSKSPRGLEIAKALGGKSGEFFGSLARIADPANIARAMGAGTSGTLVTRAAQEEIARQSRTAGADPNAPDLLSELLRNASPATAFLEELRNQRGGTQSNAERYLAEIANNTRGPG